MLTTIFLLLVFILICFVALYGIKYDVAIENKFDKDLNRDFDVSWAFAISFIIRNLFLLSGLFCFRWFLPNQEGFTSFFLIEILILGTFSFLELLNIYFSSVSKNNIILMIEYAILVISNLLILAYYLIII